MAKTTNRHESHCNHDIAVCSHCDVAFCRNCNREWGAPCHQNHYPNYWWNYTTYPVNTTTGIHAYGNSTSLGNVQLGSGGGSTATFTTTTAAVAGHAHEALS